jgi:hypothetical protein
MSRTEEESLNCSCSRRRIQRLASERARFALAMLVALPLASCGSPPTPKPFPAPADTRDGRWHQDVSYLAEELPRMHGNLFCTLKRADFDAAVSALDARIPTLSDEEITVGIGRIVALANDAHTHAWLGQRPLPIVVSWFSDGVFVTAARSDFESTLRCRVLRIGDADIDQALQRAAEIVPNEGSASWTRRQVPDLLVKTDVLRGLDLIPSSDKARFTLRAPDGTEKIVEMVPVTAGESQPWKSALSEPIPEYRKKQRINYWFEYWEEPRALVFQYNTCAEMQDKPFAEFCKELFALADEKHPDKLIVDLRYNEGGNSTVIKPFLHGLTSREELNQPGKLYVLIGRRTFSSATLNALELSLSGKATLVGEPTGGNPSSRFRESMQFQLPNSNLGIGFMWKCVWAEDRGTSVMPDVRVEASSQEYFSGRDPALERALSMK